MKDPLDYLSDTDRVVLALLICFILVCFAILGIGHLNSIVKGFLQ